ncbi:MAG: hypothetical protein FWE09_03070 [Treponema sp.]|nr:hypothetical protein [Treponema sp.]
MRLARRLAIVGAFAFLTLAHALAIAAAVFFSRDPLLVVTDLPFAALYGESRVRSASISASLSLFRPVRPLLIADDASADVLVAAIRYASERPFAVIFPPRFSEAALRFHEEFPEIPVALMRGSVPAAQMPAGEGLFGVYGTDRETDLYRAGLFAGAMGLRPRDEAGEGQEDSPPSAPERRTHVLWNEAFVGARGRELFYEAVLKADPEAHVAFIGSDGELRDLSGVSSFSIAVAGAGAISSARGVPTILFAWLDPGLTHGDVFALFDDSPWALAVPVARLMEMGEAEGEIPSKPLIISARVADNAVTRDLRRFSRQNRAKELFPDN